MNNILNTIKNKNGLVRLVIFVNNKKKLISFLSIKEKWTCQKLQDKFNSNDYKLDDFKYNENTGGYPILDIYLTERE